MLALLIDTETGGLTTDYSVLSVGAVVFDINTGKTIEEFETLIKLPSLSDYKVTEKALEINKLSVQECFEKGIHPADAANKLVDLYVKHGCTLLGGHNFIYDVRMLTANIFKCSIDEFNKMFTYRWLDSLTVMRLFEGHNDVPAGASLEKTAKALGIKVADKAKLHSALVDIRLTATILYKFRTLFMGLNLK